MSLTRAAREETRDRGKPSAGSPPPYPDEEAARRQRSGPLTDDEFVRELADRFGSGLFSFVLGLTRDRDWAEDIVQMTLIRAWRSRDRLAAAGDTARVWLYTVARHILIDDYRSRSVRPVVLAGDLRAAEHTDDIDRLVLSLTIHQALATLTEAHRQAIILSLLQRHTAAEAARMLGISEGTVKSRVHYGLRALRKELAGVGGGTARISAPSPD